jgi:hypothetical protein
MGSGISIDENQLTEIIKRDMKLEHINMLNIRKQNNISWEEFGYSYECMIYKTKLNEIDKISNMRKNIIK